MERTLESIQDAAEELLLSMDAGVETIVVDNASTDETGKVATQAGALVVSELNQGIARARNTGARYARGDFLVFVDADTVVPPRLLLRIFDLLSDSSVIGGAVVTDYRPTRRIIRYYLRLWAILARLRSMAQGVTQFCTAVAFKSIGGYDESLYMSEDVDFYWRLQRYAKATSCRVIYIDDIKVIPSTRRFDQWPVWKIFLWTNPLAACLFLRSKRFWHHWYEHPLR